MSHFEVSISLSVVVNNVGVFHLLFVPLAREKGASHCLIRNKSLIFQFAGAAVSRPKDPKLFRSHTSSDYRQVRSIRCHKNFQLVGSIGPD